MRLDHAKGMGDDIYPTILILDAEK